MKDNNTVSRCWRAFLLTVQGVRDRGLIGSLQVLDLFDAWKIAKDRECIST
jgi:hypothetical protein